MSLSQTEDEQLRQVLRRIAPQVDSEMGPAKQEKVDPLIHRAVKNGRPMLPNLAQLSDEERQSFMQSAGAQYLNNLIFTIQQIHASLADGDFDMASVHADFIWVHYPDLAPFLDSTPPTDIIKQRQHDYTNYKWSRYAEIDDNIMFSKDRKFLIPDDKYIELVAIRERAIAREYLMFVFLYQVTVGCSEMGWLLTTDNRVDYVGEEEANIAQEQEVEGDTVPDDEGYTPEPTNQEPPA